MYEYSEQYTLLLVSTIVPALILKELLRKINQEKSKLKPVYPV